MHRIDTPTAQVDKFGAGKNGFTRGNPQTGVPATALDDDYFDAVQEELAGVVEAAGFALNKANRAQLLAAIQKLVSEGIPDLKDATVNQKGIVQLSNSTNSTSQTLAATPKAVSDLGNLLLKITNNLSEIKDAGPAAVAQTLLNLGLGDAAKKDIATNAEMQVGTADKLVSLIGLMSIFGKRDFTENDYIRIPDVPGGLIIQWCLVTNLLPNVAAVSPWSWTLPIPFPNKILGGTVATAGTATPLSSSANLSGIPRTNGPIPNITGSVQNTRTDQSVSIYCIVIGR
ncbi:phage tail protein [Yersinia enterocolitica]|uniref:phage tail protein n=1 Tax=Yersinia enterocolitica TaxID=630 RepID=UPI003D02AA5D